MGCFLHKCVETVVGGSLRGPAASTTPCLAMPYLSPSALRPVDYSFSGWVLVTFTVYMSTLLLIPQAEVSLWLGAVSFPNSTFNCFWLFNKANNKNIWE